MTSPNQILSEAAFYGNPQRALEAINNGADMNLTQNLKQTALIIAVLHGHTEPARLLCLNGAGLSFIDRRGKNAMGHAVSTNNQEMIEILSRR